MNGLIRKSQWNAWLLTTSVPVLLSIIGQNSWLTVLLTASITGVLCCCALSCPKLPIPRWLCFMELGWIALFLGGIGRLAGSCWAQEGSLPAISLILLAMATFAAQNGALRGARIGATLAWLVLPLIAMVLLAGVQVGNMQWIRTDFELPSGALVAIFLLPSLSAFLPTECGGSPKWVVGILSVLAVVFAVIIDAVLGGRVASVSVNAFYEFSKSVNLFGVAERFEAIVGCVLTMGWFLLFVLLLSVAHELGGHLAIKNKKISVWLVAAAGGSLMCIMPNETDWMAVCALIFWGFLPAITQGVVGAKNIVKK